MCVSTLYLRESVATLPSRTSRSWEPGASCTVNRCIESETALELRLPILIIMTGELSAAVVVVVVLLLLLLLVLQPLLLLLLLLLLTIGITSA